MADPTIKPVARVFIDPMAGRLDPAGADTKPAFDKKVDDGYSPGLFLQAKQPVAWSDFQWVRYGLQLQNKTDQGKPLYITDVQVCYRTRNATAATGVGQIRLAELQGVDDWLVIHDDGKQPAGATPATQTMCVDSKLSTPQKIDGPIELDLRLDAQAAGSIIEIGKLSVGLGVEKK